MPFEMRFLNEKNVFDAKIPAKILTYTRIHWGDRKLKIKEKHRTHVDNKVKIALRIFRNEKKN